MNKPQKTQLVSRLKAVWRREQRLHLAEGALVFLRWGLLMFLAGVVVDWQTQLPVPGRVAILLVVLGIPLGKAWKGGWRQIRRFNAVHTALRVEERSGGMESLLVTAVQLQDDNRRRGTSQALCERTCRQAEETSGSVRAENVVSFKSLQRPACIVLAVVALYAVLGFTHGVLLMAGVGRMFAPWLAIAYPTRTHLELLNGDLVVQEGKPVRIAARISQVIPKKAKIAIRTGKGKARVRDLAVVNRECEYRIETAFRGFDYRIMAGDARSPWHSVEVIHAPNIKEARVTLEFPAYTRRSPETVEALTLTVPETTTVQWVLKLDRAVGGATVTFADQPPVPLEISDEGRTVTFRQEATESRAYGFSWVERDHGFLFASPSHYLQVAPDRAPRVELTSPDRNVYATLGRKLDLAFRGADDHGIAAAFVAYRVDKTEEEKVPFAPAAPSDGSEQRIDWDYRTALPDLEVGQTVAFAVELTDNYPGANGPHRVRSEVRRMQFMSMADYLEQIEKEKKRLLSQLRTIYREEREVHAAVLRLDASDPVFIQTCQLEAVRQDLMRERLDRLAARILDLTEDLAANRVDDPALTGTLERLRSDILEIAAKHVSLAADALRTLSGESGRPGGDDLAKAQAAHRVDSAARELGLLVLQLGFVDAAEVMAREMHAAAETQAALRLRTITAGGHASGRADEQEQLGKWLSRLFQATPRDRESSIDDALIEFTLTRIVKRLVSGGIGERMGKASALIREGDPAGAARLQSEVVAALLNAECRLRVGAEREALAKAADLLASQQNRQRELRGEISALEPETFGKRRADMARSQAALLANLQLLLLPEISAFRIRLFDDVVPQPPPVADLLAAAEKAMAKAAEYIAEGNAEAAASEQLESEKFFAELADIVEKRIAAMTEAVRIGRLSYGNQETDERLARFGDRQLGLLEKTEDAAAEGEKADYLVGQQESLLDAVEELRLELADGIRTAATASEYSLSLPVRIGEAVQAMRKAIPLLKENRPREASAHQTAAVSAFAEARKLLAEHGRNIAPYAAMLSATKAAIAPSVYVGEIEQEQRDMLALTRATPADDMPNLALPQKNLIHAVNATLMALDPISHLVETGTVMLFAKDDMDAAGTALAGKDAAEVLDAQEYVVETLQKLLAQIDAVIPQYQYLLEVTEALYETVQEGILIREAQRRIREHAAGEAVPADLAGQQDELKTRAADYARVMNEITGLGVIAAAVEQMAEAGARLGDGDLAAARDAMARAEQSLENDTATLLTLMGHLGLLLSPPAPGGKIPEEVLLVRDVLSLAARQKNLYRGCYAAKPDQAADSESALRALETACGPFIEQARNHRNPLAEGAGETEDTPVPPTNLQRHLVAAKDHLGRAAASAKVSDRENALASQKQAAGSLRHFIVEYTLKFVTPPGAAPPGEPVPSDDFTESEDLMSLFMPGVVSGKRPPDGKLEWEVLGKRERAALNENFARELPLEYRAILKDYYERLAR